MIYSLEERSKLVFLIEALPEKPEKMRVGQPVSVTLGSAKSRKMNAAPDIAIDVEGLTSRSAAARSCAICRCR